MPKWRNWQTCLPAGRRADKGSEYLEITIHIAEVAELADALGSGSSGSNPVRVQLPPSAPLFFATVLRHSQASRRREASHNELFFTKATNNFQKVSSASRHILACPVVKASLYTAGVKEKFFIFIMQLIPKVECCNNIFKDFYIFFERIIW